MIPPVGPGAQITHYPYIDQELVQVFDSIFSGHLVTLDKIEHTNLDYAGINKEYCNPRNDFAPDNFFVQGYDHQLGRFVALVIKRKYDPSQHYATRFLIITSEKKYIECSEKYQLTSRDLNKNHTSYSSLKKLFEHGQSGLDEWLYYDKWKEMHGPKKAVSVATTEDSYAYSDFC